MSEIWVLVDTTADGKVRNVTYEVLTAAVKLKEKNFTLKELYNADEVFITSSTSFVTPIIKIDSKIISKGKIGNISSQLAILYTSLFIK